MQRGCPGPWPPVRSKSVGIGPSALLLVAMIGVFGFFWWASRPAQLRRSAAARQRLPWLARGRDVDGDVDIMRRLCVFLLLPGAGLCVGAAAVALIRAVVAS